MTRLAQSLLVVVGVVATLAQRIDVIDLLSLGDSASCEAMSAERVQPQEPRSVLYCCSTSFALRHE